MVCVLRSDIGEIRNYAGKWWFVLFIGKICLKNNVCIKFN